MIVGSKETKRLQEESKRLEFEVRKFVDDYIEQFNIPNKSRLIHYWSGHPSISYNIGLEMFVWSDEKSLYFVDNSVLSPNIGKIEILLKDIEYYKIHGDVYRETKISGGGVSGGGVSLGGAIMGSMIAGDVGAIIGSRKEVVGNPITSETITNDERETFLYFSINNKKHSMRFNYETYNILLNIIPDKSYDNIYNDYVINQVSNNHKSNDEDKILDKIKRLAELKNEGILTEEEFQEKKKELLSKI